MMSVELSVYNNYIKSTIEILSYLSNIVVVVVAVTLSQARTGKATMKQSFSKR